MEIRTIDAFVDYYGKIRKRTDRVVAMVPPDQLEWAYRPGKFSIGDTIRHVAAIERYLYAETVAGRPGAYPGCGREMADGYEAVTAFYHRLRGESMAVFSGLTDDQLRHKCTTPSGAEITLWKWLRALIEHEIHHRGQLYVYLGMLGVATPPLFGLTAEDLQQRGLRSARE